MPSDKTVTTSDDAPEPFLHYATANGRAWCGDALDMLHNLPDRSINLVCTSPPFALNRKKAYGNEHQDTYLKWFRPFAEELHRVLTDDGSLVVDIGGAWVPGSPTRSVYHFELVVGLVRDVNFHLAEEFYWFNRAKLPTPAQWVTIERIRVKDSVNPVWWLSKSERPNADNRRVLKPYSKAQERLMKRGTYNAGKRPSGHVISKVFANDNGGAIPPNLIEVANTSSNDPYNAYCEEHRLGKHPARFPREVPDFFIRFLTKPGDLVLDPFAGSNMTGACAESLDRRWLAYDLSEEYLAGSLGRFQDVVGLDNSPPEPSERPGCRAPARTSEVRHHQQGPPPQLH